MKTSVPILGLSALIITTVFTFGAAPIDLSGQWEFATDGDLTTTPDQSKFPNTIQLPGQVAAQGFGEKPSMATQWAGVGWKYPDLFKEWQSPDNFKIPFFLQPPLHFVAPAWYQKVIEIPADWGGKHALLHLERVHWQSVAWVDGKQIGKCNSLGTPHEYDLGALTLGKHALTLCIDNRIVDVNPGFLAHSMTDHTQGNWNGVVGKIELRPVAALRVEEARIEPSLAEKSVKVIVTANDQQNGKVTAKVRYIGPLRDLFESESVTADLVDGRAELSIPIGREPRAWNEFTPHLYKAEIVLESASGKDLRSETFGFRDLSKKDGRLAINGVPIFLRGTLECAIFPLTGYPPTDVDAWRRIVKICKAHGLNHIRFHSWCPPEAAFIAADEAGFYYQVEASAWASNGGAEIGNGKPLDAWIDAETTRMIREFGNHPSFLMMAYGNEPGGRNHKKWLQEWVARWKAKDARRFWTTAAGWPLMPGSDYHNMPEPRIQGWGQGLRSIINAEAPRTDFDWSDHVKAHADAPFVSHEIGQWCAYPNYGEIPKYTGFFKAKNFEVFQEMAKRNGLLPQAKDFLMASGKLQTLCYKHDIEAAMRTQAFGGFQLLDLHDFPGQGTALVGVLDAFWDSKGYVTADEYARFAGPVVPLARLKKMTWQTNETLEAELQLCHFGPTDFKGLEPVWKLTDGEIIVAEGTLAARDVAAGGLRDLGSVRVPLEKLKAPAQLKLTVGARGQKFSNDWSIFVYPAEAPAAAPQNVTITASLVDALAALDEGKNVLWKPSPAEVKDDPARPLVAGFSTIFWNTPWTEWQPPHTLGILCDPKHPALAKFPTDFHSNWQWWELQKDARPFILTKHHELRPVVQIIDDWITHRKLGYVFEAKVGQGKLVACSFDLETDLEKRIVARQMRSSLLDYMSSDRFSPQQAMERADLEVLAKASPVMKKLETKLPTSDELLRVSAPESLLPTVTVAGSVDISTQAGNALKNCRPYLASRIVGTGDWREEFSTYRMVSETNGVLVLEAAFDKAKATVTINRDAAGRLQLSGKLDATSDVALELARFHYLDGLLPAPQANLLSMRHYELPGRIIKPAEQVRAPLKSNWGWGRLNDPIHSRPNIAISGDSGALGSDWNTNGFFFGFTAPGSAFGELGMRTAIAEPTFFLAVLLDAIRLDPGKSRVLETATISHGDNQQELRHWIDHCRDALGPARVRPPLVGYCSWYQLGQGVQPGQIRRVMEGFASFEKPPGGHTIQIDDGFQVMPGDWSGREKWKDELDTLPQEIRAKGFIPGIWIAPTAIHESHPIVKEHPEWLQRDAKGELCITFHNWKGFNGMTNGNTYFLEPDHPGARAFILKSLRDLRAKGWDYFKIDFAYTVSSNRAKYDPLKTTYESLRDQWRLFREGLGEDALINSCNGGMWRYTIGTVDISRVGGDIGGSMKHLRRNLAEMMLRAHANGVWFQVDPDVFYMRREKSDLNFEQSHLLTGTQGLLGTALLTSDFAEQWDAAATSVVKRYWNKNGPVVPAAQHLFLRPDGLPAALSVAYGPGDFAVGIYNWDTAPKDIAVSLKDLRLPSADYQISHADHGGERTGLTDGAITIKAQPGESLRIVRLRSSGGSDQGD